MAIRSGGLDDPAVQALLALHRHEALGSTPRANAQALVLGGLRQPGIAFWLAIIVGLLAATLAYLRLCERA